MFSGKQIFISRYLVRMFFPSTLGLASLAFLGVHSIYAYPEQVTKARRKNCANTSLSHTLCSSGQGAVTIPRSSWEKDDENQENY